MGSALLSAVPWLGGPVSNVISGYSQTRKFNRVQELLNGLANELRNFESDIAKEYVRTEDFEELLERTLRKAADERQAEVRNLYLRFIRHAITEPGDEYDAQVNVLRVIERLRSPHIAILQALRQEPSPNAHQKVASSQMQTLQERTGLDRDTIKEAVQVLNDLRLANLGNLHVMMTAHGLRIAATYAHHVGDTSIRLRWGSLSLCL